MPLASGRVAPMIAPHPVFRSFVAPLLAFAVACSEGSPVALPPVPDVDFVDPAPGVPARGYEPAVVSLETAGQVLCAGALVASDVVLTARHCVSVVSSPIQCPAAGSAQIADASPAAVVVRVGDDATSAVDRARGRAVLVPATRDFCDADIALLLLDTAIDGVAPFALRATGPATGEHVRSVSWSAGQLVLRDHVVVVATSASVIRLDELAVAFGAGGPAIDEESGAVVGVGSRADLLGPSAGTVYVRTDAYVPLFRAAMAESAFGSATRGTHLLKAHVGPADTGSTCAHGADCAAGACVALDSARYCSRACDPRDRCPPRFRCEVARGVGAVCIKT